MFGLLKNKLSSFINNLTGREEKKETAQNQEEKAQEQIPVSEEKPQPIIEEKRHEPAKHVFGEKKPEPIKQDEKKPLFHMPFLSPKKETPKPEEKKQELVPQGKEAPKSTPPAHRPEEKKQETTHPGKEEPKPAHIRPKFEEKQPELAPQKKEEPKHAPAVELSGIESRVSQEKRGMAPKIGIGTVIKSFFSSEITIGEAEVNDLLLELELSLLEADVAYEVSLEVASQLKSRLVGMKVPKKDVAGRIKEEVRATLEGVMQSEKKFDLTARVRELQKPVKILFVGTNGAGKTTTIAKVARMLMDGGLTVVFAASDTFRAAAIEQTEVHADRLGVKVIKSKYGADPASVAFDAVSYAKAHSIDAVLIDSAGRQDTNANLLDELRKINRVAKPDIKIYVGESIGGNSVIDQIKAFNEVVPMDGAILTKIDCDAKGGTAISITKTTGIPILYLGVGQAYSDIVPFDAHKLAQEIMN